jgi:GNAT superfamily N-acetyltransferase
VDVSEALAEVQAGLPRGLRVRAARPEDLPAVVAFHNAGASAAEYRSVERERHGEAHNPQPRRLRLVVDAAPGEPGDGDGLVAFGETSDGGVFARTDGTFRFELRVAPQHRGQGVGGAVLGALEAHARAQGSPRHVTAVHEDAAGSLAFATRRGYRPYHQTVHSYVDVPAFDAARFEDPDVLAARAGAHLVGFAALASEHAGDPEAFQRDLYAVASEAMRDVPSPEPRDPPPFEAIRELFFGAEALHPTASVLAVRDGRVVGLTATALNTPRLASTLFTGVARSDRGRGLALAMKLRAIAALRAAGVERFGTANDAGNAPMRGINARLGYVPDPPVVLVEKRLD